MWILIALVVVFIVGWSWSMFLTVQASEQYALTVSASRAEIVEIINRQFGKTWIRENGPGTFNLRQVFRKWPPTLSVQIVDSGDGQCDVSIWVSSYSRKLFVMNHAHLMVRKKRALAESLPAGRAAPAEAN